MNLKTRVDSLMGEGMAAVETDNRTAEVAEALDRFLQAGKTGQGPTKLEFLEANPSIASMLADCLAGMEMVERAAELLPKCSFQEGFRLLRASDRLGDYCIVRELGRGGMGVVYEAVQDSLDRRVALKVLNSSAFHDPGRRRRFRIEALAAAHLNHDHIAPVFAVGEEAGIAYYAMKYIDGMTLARHIDSLRGDSTATARGSDSTVAFGSTVSDGGVASASAELGGGLSADRKASKARFDEAARLGIQACEALAHAHALGVIHRDIKPSNLMLDRTGKLWVTDFGLARLEKDPGVTRSGELLGTLRYMSPEQALGRGMSADQRTDVYSLGATLYELLTLAPAFDGCDREVLARQSAELDPIPPRRLDPSIPRDFEIIVMKALSKDPADRYASAAEFGEDLRRYLSDMPILARRPSFAGKAMRWARRRRRLVAGVLGLAAVCSALATGLIWFEKRQTQIALAQARAGREREREYLRFVTAASDRMTMEFMRVYGTSDLRRRNELFNSFNGMLAFYGRIAPQYSSDPATRDLAARAYHRIAYLSEKMDALERTIGSRSRNAESAYRTAIELNRSILASDPASTDAMLRLGSALGDYGEFLRDLGRLGEAEKVVEEAIRWSERIDRIERSFDSRLGVACREVSFSIVHRRRGDIARAEELFGRGLDRLRRLGQVAPISLHKYHPARLRDDEPYDWSCPTNSRCDSPLDRLVETEMNLMGKHFLEGRVREAEELVRLALAQRGNDPLLLNNAAWVIAATESQDSARAREAVDLARHALALSPESAEFSNTLGLALYRLGDIEGAEAAIRRSMNGRSGGDAYDFFLMSMIRIRNGDEASAKAYFRDAMVSFRKIQYRDAALLSLKSEASRLVKDRGIDVSEFTARPGNPVAPPAPPKIGL